MADVTTNIGLILPEKTDETIIRDIYNTNWNTIDGKFSADKLAVQAKNNVDITGGSITGITDLPVADGGTGASNASGAKTNLGLGNVENLKVKLNATTAPGVSNDNTEGYSVGSRWIDITNDKEYVALDVSTGVAVWTETTQSGGGGVTKTGDFTAGKITKINNASGIIEQGTNTDVDVADGVTKKHSQNTDTQFDFYNALASDHLYSGDLDTQPVGESVVFGQLLYFNWTDKEWKLAKADVSTTMPGLRIALQTKADGESCLMLVKGYIRDDSAFEFAGAMVYVSKDTAGAMTSTAPSTTGNQLQRVGQAKSANILFFNPSIDQGEI